TYEVGGLEAARGDVGDAHGREAAGADLHAVRVLTRPRHDVVLHVAARALDAAVGLEALGQLDLPRDLTHGRGILGDLGEALAEDAAALAHFLDAAPEAVPRIALASDLALAERHVELNLRVDRVRQVLAHVEVHARRAQV